MSHEKRFADDEERDAHLLKDLDAACGLSPILPSELRAALSDDDVAAWQRGELSDDTLKAFASALAQTKAMEKGEVPKDYTKIANCRGCGEVWLWCAGDVQGCPWCVNRIAQKPIPRPRLVTCGECANFQRIDLGEYGHCKAPKLEPPGGLHEGVKTRCDRYLKGAKKDPLNEG